MVLIKTAAVLSANGEKGYSMEKYSEMEIQIAKNLMGEGYKWIAKDYDEELYAFKHKPYKDESVWYEDRESEIIVCSFVVPIFQDIKWADSEPTFIEDIIKPQILDDTERRYLECVLRPLPKVKNIKKIETKKAEYLAVIFEMSKFTAGYVNESLIFPYFETGTMYKGMIADRVYTPKELGLKLKEKT